MKPLVPGLVLVLGLTGCSGGDAPSAAPTPAAPTPAAARAAASGLPVPVQATAADCGDAAPTGRWPAGVPADLPVPPTATMGATQKSPDGLTLVRFTTSQSVRQGVVFLAQSLQPAGYTLGRGDAEAIEADVPFSRGALRGLMKMIAREQCSTQWVLALQTAQAPGAPAAPLLTPLTTASPSPLPFG